MAFRPRRYEMTTEEIVRELLEKWRPRWNAPANDSVGVNSAREEGATTREEILNIIDRLGNERKIIYAPGVQAALDAAKARHPYNNFDVYAFENRVLDKCEELRFNIASVQDLSDIMSWLIENEDVPLSAQGRELQHQQRGIEQRTREINEITRNYTAGFKIRTPNGGAKVYDKDGFEIQFSSAGGRARPKDGGFDVMTDEEVTAIHAQVMDERRLRSFSKEELKNEIINPARQQKYEASGKSLGPNPAGVDLIDPNTGAIISDKRTLIRVINSSADATKRMLVRNGVTDRTLARRFEEILNS